MDNGIGSYLYTNDQSKLLKDNRKIISMLKGAGFCHMILEGEPSSIILEGLKDLKISMIESIIPGKRYCLVELK